VSRVDGASELRMSGTIVVAVPDFEPAVGGTNRHAALLARGLAARGHDVVVVTRRRRREWRKDESVGGIRVRRIGFGGWSSLADKQALLALAFWLVSRRPRIAMAATLMWPDSALALAGSALLRRSLVVWAIRGEMDDALSPGEWPARRLFVRLRRAALRRSTHVVLTRAMADELGRHGLDDRVSIVPVPVDLAEFRPATSAERKDARDRLGLDGEFVVAYVGHLQSRKAVDRLVDAVKILTDERRVVRLLVVGGGRGAADDTEDELRAQVAAGGLGEVVRFCGVTPDPRPYLWAADAFALPSLREGMPNSLLEAMACGIPCVAPPSAGGDELLADGAGLVPASNHANELAQALRRLLDDPSLRASLAEAGRARAAEFGVEVVVDRFEALCAEMALRR
jgi:glycosyltransferase involved in cell wall biosynthesis